MHLVRREIMKEKSEQEHKYTSTGIKFWRHQEQMMNYKNGDPNTVISTHISPEGACNLSCPYCSVTHRDVHERISMDTIKQYVIDLKSRGLKAVILTGGGEPTAFKHFNELVQWIKHDQGLLVALITNGTLTRRVEDETWKCFSWVRVSINMFPNWQDRIKLPHDKLSDDCVVGCSSVYTADHESPEETIDRVALLKKISKVADNCGAEYIRLLPNCLLPQAMLIKQHDKLDVTLSQINDPRMFHQYKLHGAPSCNTCHQSFFRPYLSEVNGGTVYPCDSVVLNDAVALFAEEYALCKAEDVLDYIDHKIEQKFKATKICKGCVFTDNVNMLHAFKNDGTNRFDEFTEPLMHEEFV